MENKILKKCSKNEPPFALDNNVTWLWPDEDVAL